MSKVIVLTGAGGFIGAAVLRKLAGAGNSKVIAIARTRPGRPTPPNVSWIESNLEGLKQTHWQAASAGKIDALIHLAAFTPKSAAERDRADQIIAANIVGTQALLGSLPHPPRRLIFCSTLDVYARSAFDHVVDEHSPVGPMGLYGVSKLFGESLVASYARSKGIEHLTLRLGHIFGPGEERYTKLVPETIRCGLAGKPPRIAGDGSDKRDLLYVDDAAEAIVRAVAAGGLGDSRTINIARGQSHAIREIVATITSLLGYRGPAEHLPAPADAYSTSFDTSEMKRALGEWPLVSLHDGLAREIAWLRGQA